MRFGINFGPSRFLIRSDSDRLNETGLFFSSRMCVWVNVCHVPKKFTRKQQKASTTTNVTTLWRWYIQVANWVPIWLKVYLTKNIPQLEKVICLIVAQGSSGRGKTKIKTNYIHQPKTKRKFQSHWRVSSSKLQLPKWLQSFLYYIFCFVWSRIIVVQHQSCNTPIPPPIPKRKEIFLVAFVANASLHVIRLEHTAN